jgi:hypothetical protein
MESLAMPAAIHFDDGRLQVTHFLKCCSQGAGFFAGAEESAKLRFSRTGNNHAHDGAKNADQRCG